MANSIITLSFLIFSCFALLTPVTCSNNQTDLLSLLALKEAIDVDPQGSLNSWNKTTHFCSWKGIWCSHRHPNRVVVINLQSQGLVGSLSPHLGNLSFLRSINLQNNSFHGQIPQEIGLLRRLEFIEFSNNSFFGPIPTNLSQCPNLAYLNLIDNSLSGVIPRELGFLYKLEALGLAKNKLSGPIPQSIGNLTCLRKLSLVSCGLKGEIPESMAQLQRLRFLQLAENNLTGSIPPGLFNISAISVFGVGSNRLQGSIPSTIGLSLPNLRSLVLGANRFGGRVPVSLSNASSLELLDLPSNYFTGPMQRVGGLSRLKSFYASGNSIEDNISFVSSMMNCTNLRHLDVGENLLSGSMPDTIANLSTHLDILRISSTQVNGKIPSGIGNLVGLTSLDLFANNLEGPISRLQGEVPILGVLRNKTAISLDGNKELCGGILELKLPPCSSIKSRKKNVSTLQKVLIPILIAGGICLTLSICFVIFIHKKRMSQRKIISSESSLIHAQFLRLSYADILKATGGFSETNLIGFGRFGSVYKGILDDGKTLAAVKVLNLVVEGASKSFMAECNALRGIKHRNLVKILCVCESINFQGNDFKSLIYEFKANGSLEKWLYHNREQEGDQNAEIKNLNMIQRLNIAIDIAHALEYLHCGTDSTIVHGDLKPSNILLDYDMTACVGDFGLAKIISNIVPSHESNSSIRIRGTLGYIPPEYATSFLVSTQGDIYSYGILLLEMFTNKRPTDDAFDDHVDLHNFVNNALPDHVMEIVDPLIQIEHDVTSKIKDCMASILSIGVACSRTVPKDRMLITHVATELHKIRDYYIAGESS